MFKADTMEGRDHNILYGLPLLEVARIMRKYGHPGVQV